MTEAHPEIASHTPREGLCGILLHGGPWDGKEVHVRFPDAPFVQVNGPRYGNHGVWITHLYRRLDERYEFVRTEVTPIAAVCGNPPPGSP